MTGTVEQFTDEMKAAIAQSVATLMGIDVARLTVLVQAASVLVVILVAEAENELSAGAELTAAEAVGRVAGLSALELEEAIVEPLNAVDDSPLGGVFLTSWPEISIASPPSPAIPSPQPPPSPPPPAASPVPPPALAPLADDEDPLTEGESEWATVGVPLVIALPLAAACLLVGCLVARRAKKRTKSQVTLKAAQGDASARTADDVAMPEAVRLEKAVDVATAGRPTRELRADPPTSGSGNAMATLDRAPVVSFEVALTRSPMGLGLGLSDVKTGGGVTFNRVTAVEGAAKAAGITLFDRIVAVDGTTCGKSSALPLIAGKRTLKLTIERPQLTAQASEHLLALRDHKKVGHERVNQVGGEPTERDDPHGQDLRI